MGNFADELFQFQQDAVFGPFGQSVDFRPVHFDLPYECPGGRFVGALRRRGAEQ